MPNITVELFEGRTLEQKRRFVEELTKLVVEILETTPEAVRIRFDELSREDLARAGRLAIDEANR